MSVKVHHLMPTARESSPRPITNKDIGCSNSPEMCAVSRNEIGNRSSGDGECAKSSSGCEEINTTVAFHQSLPEKYFSRCLGDGRQKQSYLTGVDKELSSSCTENETPTYIKWAENLHYLLMDSEGVELFKNFLAQENHETCGLDFWYACEGLKKTDPKKTDYIHQVIKLIYKNFIKKVLKEIKQETKQEIANKLSSKSKLDQTIFNAAQKEVEEIILKTTYPNFLKSDIYLQHIQTMQNNAVCDSPRNDGIPSVSEASSSSAPPSRDGLDILPTLHEDSELNIDPSYEKLILNKEPYRHTKFNGPRFRPESQAGHYLCISNSGSKSCHVKYSSFLPTSAQDSELQSLSSDAHTDDTLSLTDSMDGVPSCSSKSYHKKHACTSRRNACINRDYLPHHAFISRTQHLPEECTSKKDPTEFAAVLIEKLNVVKKQQETQEKINATLSKMEVEDKGMCRINDSSSSVNALAGLPEQLLSKLNLGDESDQSILDEHVSRVWNDSAHHTPSRSPGHLSPPPVDRRKSAPGSFNPVPRIVSPIINEQSYHSATSSMHRNRNIQCSVSHYNGSSRHRKDRDVCSNDSGTVRDFIPDEPLYSPHAPVHVHKHYHHYASGANATLPPMMHRAMADQYTVPNDHQGRRSKETARRICNKKNIFTDSSSSCVDSGVSVACDPLPVNTSVHDRVYNWVLSNEKYSSSVHGPDSENNSSRHKKSSHSSTSPVLSRPSKKPVAYSNSRSGTLDHGSTPWPMGSAAPPAIAGHSYDSYSCPHPYGTNQAQPITRDLSIPPPDTTAQLMEVGRRLEDEKRGRQTKIKKSGKKSIPESSNRGSLNAGDVTVIGYCFGSESVPYLTKLNGKNITLRQFKTLISRKGNFRYFFKRASDEFKTGAVNEEIADDNEVLPLWEGKIFATVQPII